jgi:recombination protein RecA
MNRYGKKWDLFISHSSEDKSEVVRPLSEMLMSEGLEVWYDEFSLKLGDSLRRSIDIGLKYSKYGVVVLSPSFFNKEWTQKELDGLVAKEEGGGKVILPIWHNVSREEVFEYSPVLADKLAVSTEVGLENVVKTIIHTIEDALDDKAVKESSSKTLLNKTASKRVQSATKRIETISSGLIQLDLALGVGGLPLGHTFEIISPPSAGKTTLLLSIVRQFQNKGLPILYIDADYALETPTFMRSGVKVTKLNFIQESDLDSIHSLIVGFLNENKKHSLVIVDSIASVVNYRLLQSSLSDYGEKDTFFRQMIINFVRTLKPLLNKKNSILIYSNQIIEKVAIMFGNPETTPWFTQSIIDTATIRLDLRRLSPIKDGSETIGQRVKIKVIKNKLSAPYKEIELDILFSCGVDFNADLFDFALDNKIIKKIGSKYKYKNNPFGNPNIRGRLEAIKELGSNTELRSNIELDVNKIIDKS